jgi:predicted ATPase
LWHLGYPDQALKRSQEALTLARKLSRPFNLAYALDLAAVLHQFRGEEQATQEQAEAAMSLSTEHGFPVWLAMGSIFRGWALAEQGQGAEGIAQMRQGLAAWRATGAEVSRPWFLVLLAGAYEKVEQPEEGLSVLAEALAMVDKNGEHHYKAELYRLKGQLTLQKFQVSGSKFQVTNSQFRRVGIAHQGESITSAETVGGAHPTKEVEACFLQAIDIARKQQAKSLELRAVMSLSRLWHQQGKKEEARQMLAEIYGWFTEGFDTADLKEAKALLDELA